MERERTASISPSAQSERHQALEDAAPQTSRCFIHPQGQMRRALRPASNGEPASWGSALGPGLKAARCGWTGRWDSRNSGAGQSRLSVFCGLAVTSQLPFPPAGLEHTAACPEPAWRPVTRTPGCHTASLFLGSVGALSAAHGASVPRLPQTR